MRKNVVYLTVILSIVLTGCRGVHKQSTDDFITVDVTKKYPQKELILQDLFDVEYIALETNDDFLTQGVVLSVGKDVLLVKNNLNDGDIFVFDRTGKGLRIFNRKGQGAEEYPGISEIELDEDNNELFVNGNKRILVYDLNGRFLRSLPLKEGSSYGSIRNFDKESLICHDDSFALEEDNDNSPFVILSKKDGSILTDIPINAQIAIPLQKRINHNEMIVVFYSKRFPSVSAIPYYNNWILTTFSSDTVFSYLPDRRMIPLMVRTPSIESKDAESFLYPVVLTDQYYFLRTVTIEPEARGTNHIDTRTVFSYINLMYERQEKTICEYTVVNEDFTNKVIVGFSERKANNEIAFWQILEAHVLVDAYGKGQLKGQLKEMAAGMDAEDNPVILLAKYKQ